MRIVITSGPSYEPLDKVRRLSNFSTGELGTLLAEGVAEAGHSVVCFRGVASTFPSPLWPVEVIPFTTNDDLAAGLQALPAREEAGIVFHAAALCDFRIGEITDENGGPLHGDKISSRAGALKLTLEPAPKLITSLRGMFPASILVGWKYELDGTTDQVLAKGRRQMDDCLTDACVLNGAAYGSGFGFISRSGEQAHLPDKAALCRFLIEWAERTPTALAEPRAPSFHALSSFTSLSPFI
ncbi:MAG TPA: phosphopantothenoylcysteine decarboxylase [Candidatus Methylacidiphilales bacterium]|jgi:phosphopantothenoylcysteine synthetase/decarboxylase|nr:phosphopantothenoylcysteine decarboxylase [Candidatus Methylacidiphilales bacterium]